MKICCQWMFGVACVWCWPALGWAQPAASQPTAAIMPAPTDQATLAEHHAEAAQAVFESLSARGFAVIASSDVERQIHQLEPSIRNCRTDADCMREVAKLMGTQYAVAVVVWPKEKSRTPSRVAVSMVAAESDAEADSDQFVQAAGVAHAASQAAAQAWGRLSTLNSSGNNHTEGAGAPLADDTPASSTSTWEKRWMPWTLIGLGVAGAAAVPIVTALSAGCENETPDGVCQPEKEIDVGMTVMWSALALTPAIIGVLWLSLGEFDNDKPSSQGLSAKLGISPGSIYLKGQF